MALCVVRTNPVTTRTVKTRSLGRVRREQTRLGLTCLICGDLPTVYDSGRHARRARRDHAIMHIKRGYQFVSLEPAAR